MGKSIEVLFLTHSVYMSYTSSHNRPLPTRAGHLTEANFIARLLYKNGTDIDPGVNIAILTLAICFYHL